jgi:hypothetical protein
MRTAPALRRVALRLIFPERCLSQGMSSDRDSPSRCNRGGGIHSCPPARKPFAPRMRVRLSHQKMAQIVILTARYPTTTRAGISCRIMWRTLLVLAKPIRWRNCSRSFHCIRLATDSENPAENWSAIHHGAEWALCPGLYSSHSRTQS